MTGSQERKRLVSLARQGELPTGVVGKAGEWVMVIGDTPVRGPFKTKPAAVRYAQANMGLTLEVKKTAVKKTPVRKLKSEVA